MLVSKGLTIAEWKIKPLEFIPIELIKNRITHYNCNVIQIIELAHSYFTSTERSCSIQLCAALLEIKCFIGVVNQYYIVSRGEIDIVDHKRFREF